MAVLPVIVLIVFSSIQLFCCFCLALDICDTCVGEAFVSALVRNILFFFYWVASFVNAAETVSRLVRLHHFLNRFIVSEIPSLTSETTATITAHDSPQTQRKQKSPMYVEKVAWKAAPKSTRRCVVADCDCLHIHAHTHTKKSDKKMSESA